MAQADTIKLDLTSAEPIRGGTADAPPPEAPRARAQAPKSSPIAVLAEADVEPLSESGPLQVFSIKLQPPIQSGFDYLTLDEALAEADFEAEEVDETGQVPRVKVKNPSDRLVLLMAGEMLVGCKQDRVLNKSIMVAPQSEVLIPVSCVEAGRWHARSASFGSAKLSSYAALRKSVSKNVSDSYKTFGAPESDQQQVWRSVQEKMARMGSSSASDALHTVFEDYEERLSDSLGGLREPRNCHGVVFALNGRIEGADLFDRPSTLTKLWPKLARSYAIESMEAEDGESEPTSPNEVVDWLKSASAAKTEWFDSPGLGKDGRIEGRQLHGGTLVVEDDLVHLEIFFEDEHSGSRTEDSRWPKAERRSWRRLKELFDEAIDLEPGERAAFLDSLGCEDHELRQELERLLDTDARTGDSFAS